MRQFRGAAGHQWVVTNTPNKILAEIVAAPTTPMAAYYEGNLVWSWKGQLVKVWNGELVSSAPASEPAPAPMAAAA